MKRTMLLVVPAVALGFASISNAEVLWEAPLEYSQ